MKQFVKTALANLQAIESEMTEEQDWFRRLRRDEKQIYRAIIRQYSSIARSTKFEEIIQGKLKDLRKPLVRWLELEEKDLSMVRRLKAQVDKLASQKVVPLADMQNMLVIADGAEAKVGDIIERLKKCTELIEVLISAYEAGTIRNSLHEKTKKAEYIYVMTTLGRIIEAVRRTFKDEKKLLRGMKKGLAAEREALKKAKKKNPLTRNAA
jgi:hypothetical protein